MDMWAMCTIKLIIIEMSRALLSALSAATVVGGTAFYFIWKKITSSEPALIDRLTIKKIIIMLRKKVYSTLREISFIVNNIRTLEGDLEARKISEIFMRDGGSGEKKLQAIEALVMQEMQVTLRQFQNSCTHYMQQRDIQICILLESFRKDLDLALEGVIETYNGPIPQFSCEKILSIQQNIIKRRMDIIYKRFGSNLSNEQCLRLQFQIQEYLALQGIHHEKQPNEKVFLSILERYYRTDCEFKEKFEQLELEMEMFIIDMENKTKKERQARRELAEEGENMKLI